MNQTMPRPDAPSPADAPAQRLSLRGAVWMTVNGDNLGGAGRMALLARVAECGSITQAAKAMKMSYKAAWDAIDTMNTLAGTPLVERLAGGRGGGGTRLTARGQQLVRHFRLIEQAHRRFVDHLNQQAGSGLLQDWPLIQSMGMRTSARNQFFGTVTHIASGDVTDLVTLHVPGLPALVAAVAPGDVHELGLAPGQPVFALVNAASVIVAAPPDGRARFAARNQWPATVASVRPGVVNTELTLALPGGGTLAALMTRTSECTLALAEGEPVLALFKASSVIVGVPF
ncbi:MAG: TOBE domain-containing protein [Pseudomonadota bacterium]|nr:TOBE domain-containing protein [Pseudomonadota bacterium]